MKIIISIVAPFVLAFLPACAQQARPAVAVLGDSYSTFEGFFHKKIDTKHGHPTIKGMRSIADQVLAAIRNNSKR